MSLCILTLGGYLGRDAAIKETQNGDKFVTLTVANSYKDGQVEKTRWYDVTSFNYKRYENMVQYLKKGTYVEVVGTLRPDLEQGTDGKSYLRLRVNALTIEFGGGAKNEGISEPQTQQQAVTEKVVDKPVETVVTKKNPFEEVKSASSGVDDDLPF